MVNTEIRFIICFAVKAEELYTVNKNKTGADYASDLQLLIANFRLKLKKVGKTIRPFKYDINQIAYDYTVGKYQFFGTQPSLFSLGIASFLEDISSLSNSVVYLCFF